MPLLCLQTFYYVTELTRQTSPAQPILIYEVSISVVTRNIKVSTLILHISSLINSITNPMYRNIEDNGEY